VADNGYVGHVDKIKCPKNPANPPGNLKMQGSVRSRHETLNGRLKNWGILSQTFRHDISLHGSSVLHACAGPYPAGKYNDIAIFNKVLRHYLEPWERVEADNGMLDMWTKSSVQRTLPAKTI
jgi:hypothetical protein